MTSMTSLTPVAKPERLPGSLFGGIDTHKNTHHVAVVDGVGQPVADREFATTPTGYTEIVAFFHSHGAVEHVGVEGTGSYGAGVSRVLSAAGLNVHAVSLRFACARTLQTVHLATSRSHDGAATKNTARHASWHVRLPIDWLLGAEPLMIGESRQNG